MRQADLLKKVGDGYIFMHRMLLEYFADMAPQSRTSEDGKTGSAGTGHIGLKASVKG